MAKSKKQIAVAREVRRLNQIFEELDENKRATAKALIERAAFLTVSLQELELMLEETGWVEGYQNGENQHGLKKSAAADCHISLTKNLNSIIKQLLDITPPAARKSKLDELMNL